MHATNFQDPDQLSVSHSEAAFLVPNLGVCFVWQCLVVSVAGAVPSKWNLKSHLEMEPSCQPELSLSGDARPWIPNAPA